MHSLVHTSEMSSSTVRTYEDDLWEGLNDDIFRVIQENGKPTIAWNLWHVTRIEDITSNVLIADDSQVLNNGWLKKLNSEILDTGNAMTVKEIEDFSNRVNMIMPYHKFVAHYGIGIKIVDEAHLRVHATTMLDLAANIPINIYLTATFDTNNKSLKKYFYKFFSPNMRFGGQQYDKYCLEHYHF